MSEPAAVIDGELTAAQRKRRTDILNAARALAIKGGYDAVQMRDVSEKAGVALGTLYRYFPSKTHLLIAVMQDMTVGLVKATARRPPSGAEPADRVIALLEAANAGLHKTPGLAEAMIRSIMFADASAAADVDRITALTAEALSIAIHGEAITPTAEEARITRIIGHVWWSNILGWLAGRSSPEQMSAELAICARRLLV
ncbi:MAG: AcrR family transcriptional regulator [Glaciecola sp.]|jgi:AcrR family transcriptional regulator